MSSEHAKFHFSIRVHTDDLAVLHCLRALAQYAQQEGNKRIPWGGTKERDWERDGHEVTFHFTTGDYRDSFVAEACRLLPEKSWDERGRDNDDPATPQDASW